jgi:hypothetical protein
MNTGNLVIRGDPANRDVYIIPGTVANVGCCTILSSNVQFAGVNFNQATNNNCQWFTATTGAQITLTNCSFSGVSQPWQDLAVFRGAEIILFGTIKTSGNKAGFIGCQGGNVTNGGSLLIQVVGNPTYSAAFCYCTNLSVVMISPTYTSFSGSPIGARYSASFNSIINTGGAGASYFPGNTPGSVSTGSYYI